VNRLRQRLAEFFLAPRVSIVLPLLIAVFAAIQQVILTVRSPAGHVYTHYNNFAIFRQAFVHLLDGRNLYGFFPAEHFDNFLYSPTFAALMAPFAVLPVWLGLLAWDLANAAVLLLGVRSLPDSSCWPSRPASGSGPGRPRSSWHGPGPANASRSAPPSWARCSCG